MKFDFDDINLIPQKCVVNSRSECDTFVRLGGFTFKMPVIPANMECVLNEDLAIKLAKEGYFYIMHRFCDTLDFVRKMNEMYYSPISISVGVNQDSYKLIDDIVKHRYSVHFITIDIAHGHAIKMQRMIAYIKDYLPNTFIIAGNVSTPEAVEELTNWGANAIKVGIGPGCFVADAEVITKNGLSSFNELNIGDFVLTHQNRYRKILNITTTVVEDDLIKINHLPACTKTHEFYVINQKDESIIDSDNIHDYAFWLQAQDIRKDEHLLLYLNEFDASYSVIDIEEIKVVEYFGALYDLTIEEDESYNINGYIVHNSACTTYPSTGFGSRNCQASTIMECAKASIVPIIADGGIKHPMDITKSLVLGATLCMVGGMLSGFNDSPGDIINIDGKIKKEFWGSASKHQNSKTNRIEGIKNLIDYKNKSILDEMLYLQECLQSSISYAGGKDLKALINVKYK